MVRAVKKGAILRGLRGVAIGAGAQRLRETWGICASRLLERMNPVVRESCSRSAAQQS
jgi:hypothetical protein